MGDPLVTRAGCNSDMALTALTAAETVEIIQEVQEQYQRAMLMTVRALWYEADDAQMRAEAALHRLSTAAQARG